MHKVIRNPAIHYFLAAEKFLYTPFDFECRQKYVAVLLYVIVRVTQYTLQAMVASINFGRSRRTRLSA